MPFPLPFHRHLPRLTDDNLSKCRPGQLYILRYYRNPSLPGLVGGALIGLLNSALLVLLAWLFFPGAVSLRHSLVLLNTGLFSGLFAGGVLGLICHARNLSAATLLNIFFSCQALLLSLFYCSFSSFNSLLHPHQSQPLRGPSEATLLWPSDTFRRTLSADIRGRSFPDTPEEEPPVPHPQQRRKHHS